MNSPQTVWRLRTYSVPLLANLYRGGPVPATSLKKRDWTENHQGRNIPESGYPPIS